MPLLSTLRRTRQKGLTIIELIVVMALFIILASLSLYLSFDAFRGYAFHTEEATLVSVLQKARSQAVSNICLGSGCTDGRPHGVEVLADKYVIFQGESYTGHDSGLDEEFEASAIVDHIPTSTEVVFVQLSGDTNASPSAAITIQLRDSVHSSAISINHEGQISW